MVNNRIGGQYGDLVKVENFDQGLGDAFGRMRVSNPVTAFESNFQYDLAPLIYEQIVASTGTVTHDATNSLAVFTVILIPL